MERGFRCLKDVLEMRPIYHKSEGRVRAHIFVAALALLMTRVLERRLKDAGLTLFAEQALQHCPPCGWLVSRLVTAEESIELRFIFH